jgi:DNA repair protein RecN (Recombination protein N)
MINERDGNVEALALLPKALEAEKEALQNFEIACQHLSAERTKVSSLLLGSVNSRLPSLGMKESTFHVALDTQARRCTDAAAYIHGCDAVEFMLHHGLSRVDENRTTSVQTGGSLHRVASAGEKARILLAMECSLPGCIRGTMKSTTNSKSMLLDEVPPPTPVAVVYDEIDAHVGGSAAVAIGHMLEQQALQTQILAITHSPAVAASANAHITVSKQVELEHMVINVVPVYSADRKKEIARMAAGDIAMDEAEAFAEALIQNGVQRRIHAQR